MDKPFRLWHKGAILNLQGCKEHKIPIESVFDTNRHQF